MSTIFISHSSLDNELARDVERRLAEQGHPSVFLDLDPEKGIVAGQSWERTLYRKLRACRAIIAICTDNYLSSHWCFAEVALARMMGKLIFALQVPGLSEGAQMPSILVEKQFIDLRNAQSDGYRRLWAGLKEADVLGIGSEYDPRKEGPYLGLSTFEEKHAAIFFGRDSEIREGIEILERGAPGLIMVLGASGSGKSSLVRAGIVPRVRRDPEQWIVADPFRPGRDPFMELAAVLENAYGFLNSTSLKIPSRNDLYDRLKAGLDSSPPHSSEPQNPSRDNASKSAKQPSVPPLIDTDERLPQLIKHLESLQSDPPPRADNTLLDYLDWSIDDLRSLIDRDSGTPSVRDTERDPRTPLKGIARHLRRVSGHPHARLLVIVDQFEELLGHEDQELASQFLRLIRASVESGDSPVVVIGTMRSDYLGMFQQNAALRGVEYASLSLGPMSVDAMQQVIEKPADLADVTLEEGLAYRLLKDTETPDALPLLSFTLWKLFRDYTDADDRLLEIAEYTDLGGIHGAISKEADAVAEVARNQGVEDELRKAFLRMARLNEDESNYSRQLASLDDPAIACVEHVLRLFEKRRLVVFRKDGDSEFVEVAHEALFRAWVPLKNWLDDNRAEMLLRRQIERDATAWEQAGKASDRLWGGARLIQACDLMEHHALSPIENSFVETSRERARRAARKARIFVIAAALGAVAVMASLGWVVYSQQQVANSQQQVANSQREALFAQQQVVDAQRQAIIAAAIALDDQSEPPLMWARQDNGEGVNFEQARSYCEELVLFDYRDWRLPAKMELDAMYGSETLASKLPLSISTRTVWAINTDDNTSASAWRINEWFDGVGVVTEEYEFSDPDFAFGGAVCVRNAAQ